MYVFVMLESAVLQGTNKGIMFKEGSYEWNSRKESSVETPVNRVLFSKATTVFAYIDFIAQNGQNIKWRGFFFETGKYCLACLCGILRDFWQ